jgi:hypothetical protein
MTNGRTTGERGRSLIWGIIWVIGASVDIRNDHLPERSQNHYRLSQKSRPISETFVAEFPTCSETAVYLPAIPNLTQLNQVHTLCSCYMSCPSHHLFGQPNNIVTCFVTKTRVWIIGSSLVLTTISSYTLKITVTIAHVTSHTKSSNCSSGHTAVPLELGNSSEVNFHPLFSHILSARTTHRKHSFIAA